MLEVLQLNQLPRRLYFHSSSIAFNEHVCWKREVPMLIEVHYGDDCTLLVNGNSRGIHVMEYIRSRCDVSPLIPIDLCMIHSGEPINLSSFDSKLLSTARDDLPSHLRCVLARIDDQGAYIPLLNSSKLVTNEFLAKMKRATNSKNSPKSVSKPNKQTPGSPVKQSPGSGTKQTSNGSNKQSSNSATKQPPSSPTKQSSSTTPKPPQMRRRRSLKAIAIAATLAASNSHQ